MSEPNPDPEFEERLDAVFQGEQTDGADDDPRLQSAMSVLELIARVKRDGEAVRPLAGDTAKPAGTTLPDSTASPDLPKTIGRFQIRKVLGRGGNGVVFLAHDPSLNRDVALKVPLLDALLDPSLRSRFLREAKAAAALNHTNVVPVFEVGADGPTVYIAAAFCEGPTLGKWAGANRPVDCRIAAAIVSDLASAVQHAHDRGVVHRDLKPSNVLIDFAGDSRNITPQITDFGMARLEDDVAERTRTGTILGTPEYMSPEQSRGKPGEQGPATDIYSLGAVLYFLLSGKPPFLGENLVDTLQLVRNQPPVPLSKIREDVPLDLQAICLRCLEKEPSQRYGSAHAVRQDLDAFLSGRPVNARNASLIERTVRLCRRNPVITTLTTVIAGLTITAVIGSIWAALHFQSIADDRTKALGEKADALREATAANLAADERLRASLLSELEAHRWSKRVGHRMEAIKAARTLRQTMKKLGISDGLGHLRTEVIDIAGRLDLRRVSADTVAGNRPRFEIVNGKVKVVTKGVSRDLNSPASPANAEPTECGRLGPYLFVQFSNGSRLFFESDSVKHILTAPPHDGRTGGNIQWRVSSLGETIFRGDNLGTIYIWLRANDGFDVDSFRIMRNETASERIFDFALNKDGTQFATTVMYGGEIQIYDTKTHEKVASTGPSYPITAKVDWAPDRKIMVTARRNEVRLLDAKTLKPIESMRVSQSIDSVKASPDGKTIAIGFDASYRLVGNPSLETVVSGDGEFHSFDATGRYMRVADDWYEVVPGELSATYVPPSSGNHLRGVTFSPDSRYLLKIGRNEVHFQDTEPGGRCVTHPLPGASGGAFRSDRSAVIVSSKGLFECTLRGVDNVTDVETERLSAHVEDLQSQRLLEGPVAVDRISDEVFFVDGLKVSQLAGGKLVRHPPIKSMGGIAVSPDGRWVGFTGEGFKLFDRRLGFEKPAMALGREFGFCTLAFTGDSQHLVNRNTNDTRVIEVETWKQLVKLPASNAMAVSNRGLIALLCSEGAKLYDLKTGAKTMTLRFAPKPGNTHFTFSPDGSKLAVNSAGEGSVRVWDMDGIARQLNELDLNP